ncbi:hypothetical protein J5N97_029923 [Dioscorea zingiberensis]|uniref:Sororin C-terminal region domain-containing protein n=1 Tax=Dioscorea zingiberensis TaxID=325984 RepID=A0A9D5BWU1_9LILI|nr:hypothetical protein J5N97_029923 [Dioscorea zingiberensis]
MEAIDQTLMITYKRRKPIADLTNAPSFSSSSSDAGKPNPVGNRFEVGAALDCTPAERIKRTRDKSNMQDSQDTTLPQDFVDEQRAAEIEKLRAYFAEIDAFELVVEEVSDSELEDKSNMQYGNVARQGTISVPRRKSTQIRLMENKANEEVRHGDMTRHDTFEKVGWLLPVLAMTADVIEAKYEECIKCGMDGYVSKPFDKEQLYQAVAKFMISKAHPD